MNSFRKTRMLVLAVVAAGVAGAFVWQTQFSREAQIERAYESCLRQFGGNAVRQATPGRTETVAAGSGPTLTDSLGKAMEDLVRGVTAGMSGAVCGAVREACKTDFEGAVCRNALAGFR